MKQQTASVTKFILAPATVIYEIIADYRNLHPLILPKPNFLSLDVEEGGYGAGTIVNFKMRILGQTQSFRSLITEPDPGRVLLETDIKSGVSTRFHVTPKDENSTQVSIATELKNRGALEAYVAKIMLQKIYRQELELLTRLAQKLASSAQSATVHEAR